jgi:hypothetical protein
MSSFECVNCGGASTDAYCSHCGQKRVREDDLSVRHAWHHVIHETLHLDGRIVSTLRLLFTRPGQLTLDYLEGRRARYIHPIRLFVVFSAIYFLAEGMEFASDILESPAGASTRHALGARAAREMSSYPALLQTVDERARVAFKMGFVGSVVAAGWLFWRLFRRTRPYFAQNMIFALHMSCFLMAVSSVMGLLGRFTNLQAVLSGATAVAVMVYGNMAVRRAYPAEPAYRHGIAVPVFYFCTFGIGIIVTIVVIFLSRP